jgi:hypothetical protein
MGSRWREWIVCVMLGFGAPWLASGPVRAAENKTITGIVSDASCGSQHMMMTISPAECTRQCVRNGSKYTLIVGDKTYVLNTADKGILTVLDQQAGKKVTVSGTVNGVAVEVSTVVPAK